MLYKAKANGDTEVFKCKVIGNGIPFGYELVKSHFVDNSGWGTESEQALTAKSFLGEVKKGFYYGIQEAGQFQVYIGEFKKVSRKNIFKKEGILKSKKISKSCRVTEYENGDKTISLYSTDIVKFIGRKIVLNSGGYKTVTTRRRINEFIRPENSLYQKNSEWYILNKGKSIVFEDGIEIEV